jgi:hypothetical protein
MGERYICADQHGNLQNEHSFSAYVPSHRDRG